MGRENMADPVDKQDQWTYTPAPQAASGGWNYSTPPESHPVSDFVGNLVNTVNPIPAIKQAVTDPVGFAKGIGSAQMGEFSKAREALAGQGEESGPLPMRLLSAAGHGLAGALPIVGPMAAHAGEQIGSGDVAGGLGTATGLLAPFGAHAIVPRALEAIPSAERAGRNFDTVMNAARDQPLDLTPAQQYLTRAQQLQKTGAGGIPPPLKMFGKAISDPNEPPMTYATGRDFASNAGSLSARQSMKTNAPMKAQLRGFAATMDDINRQAAEQAGVGKQYGDAMTEYRRAMQIRNAADAAKRFAGTTAGRAIGYGMGGALGGALGYRAMKGLTE
jgi:hypothetical protein